MTIRVLTQQAEDDRVEWELNYDGCSCHISPPCSSCIHLGNPSNQDEDDSCWELVDTGPINWAAHHAGGETLKLPSSSNRKLKTT
ncbi:MAG: hypothetical protein M0Q44_01130 [Methylobacter sp.]|nr:hypothetical protein [Methylobacter sp.]